MEEYRSSYVKCTKKFFAEFSKNDCHMITAMKELGYCSKFKAFIDLGGETLISDINIVKYDDKCRQIPVAKIINIRSDDHDDYYALFPETSQVISDSIMDENGKFLFGLMKDAIRINEINMKMNNEPMSI